MKRLALFVMVAVAALALGGCEYEDSWYMPDSHWILKIRDEAEGRRLALTFDGQSLTTHDGSADTPPFTGTEVWQYRISSDELFVSRSEWDGEYNQTVSYRLDISYREGDDEMELSYKGWGNRRYVYHFERR